MESPSESLPAPPPATPSVNLDDDSGVQSAVRFLQDPRVKNSPVERKISFLKTKGLSAEQIQYAFKKVGVELTIDKINAVGAHTPATTQAASQSSAPPQPTSASQVPVLNPYQPSTRTHTLFPNTQPPLPDTPETKGVDWRDVVIGVGAAAIAGFAGVKLFQRYSPYEIRRKSEKKVTAQTHRHMGVRRRAGAFSSSDSDRGSAPAPRSNVPPLPPPPATATTVPAEAQVKDASEEVKRLEAELAETKEALTTERKKGAEYAVSAARVRGEKQQLSRTNDKLTQQIEELQEKLKKLEEKDQPAPADPGENPDSVMPDSIRNLLPVPETGSPAAAPLPGPEANARMSPTASFPGTPSADPPVVPVVESTATTTTTFTGAPPLAETAPFIPPPAASDLSADPVSLAAPQKAITPPSTALVPPTSSPPAAPQPVGVAPQTSTQVFAGVPTFDLPTSTPAPQPPATADVPATPTTPGDADE